MHLLHARLLVCFMMRLLIRSTCLIFITERIQFVQYFLYRPSLFSNTACISPSSSFSLEELRCQDLGVVTSAAGAPTLGSASFAAAATATAITTSDMRSTPDTSSLSALLADAEAEYARVDAWNAQPLGSWTCAQLCDRVFAPEYDIDDALNTGIKLVVASAIERQRLAGSDLKALVDAIRIDQSTSSAAGGLMAAWLPGGFGSAAQTEVYYTPFYLRCTHGCMTFSCFIIVAFHSTGAQAHLFAHRRVERRERGRQTGAATCARHGCLVQDSALAYRRGRAHCCWCPCRCGCCCG